MYRFRYKVRILKSHYFCEVLTFTLTLHVVYVTCCLCLCDCDEQKWWNYVEYYKFTSTFILIVILKLLTFRKYTAVLISAFIVVWCWRDRKHDRELILLHLNDSVNDAQHRSLNDTVNVNNRQRAARYIIKFSGWWIVYDEQLWLLKSDELS